jgi:NAD(P)-dependent dehydrogenase (short-subunit alcohol dehydrogenase family)
MTDEDWSDVIGTNLNGPFHCTSAAIPAMMEQKFGRIVSIASFVGQAGNFGQANYAASKGGLIAFTKVLAIELARNNITANVIAPGFTTTEMTGAIPIERLEQVSVAELPEDPKQRSRQQRSSRKREHPRRCNVSNCRHLQPAMIGSHGPRHAGTQHMRGTHR